MPNSPTCDEILRPVIGLPGCIFNELTTALPNRVGSATLISLLLDWADEQQCETRGVRETETSACSHEINSPCQEVREGGHERRRGTQGWQETGISTRSHEVNTALQKVSAGPWISAGGYFDYSGWADRERFMELDKAISGEWVEDTSDAGEYLGARDAVEEPKRGLIGPATRSETRGNRM